MHYMNGNLADRSAPCKEYFRSCEMTHVVTDSCIRCKYTDCVEVCPVDCFHEGPDFLVIDPDECIDCAVYIPECPVNAIQVDTEVPAAMAVFLDLNRKLAQEWPVIVKHK